MPMQFTQDQYNLLQRPVRYLRAKIDLLNSGNVTIDSLEGYATDGSITTNASSANRNVGSLQMVIHNNNLLPSPSSKIWFNNKMRVWIGLEDYVTGHVTWFNKGVFAFDQVDLNYSNNSLTISVDLKDSMALLDGTLGGNLKDAVKMGNMGATIRQAVREVLTSLVYNSGFPMSLDPIVIDEGEATLPYEITEPANSNKYNIIRKLIDLYKGYEFFFDVNGVFVLQKVKDFATDPVIWDFRKANTKLITNYSRRFAFSDIANSVHIIGKQQTNGELIRYSYRNRYSRPNIAYRDAITDQEIGDICTVMNTNVSYTWNGTSWIPFTSRIPAMFCIEQIGEKYLGVADQKIQELGVAKLRGEYELWKKSNFAETINISCVPIYFLDVNRKIALDIPEVGIEGEYLINSITTPLNHNGTMSIEATKIYY